MNWPCDVFVLLLLLRKSNSKICVYFFFVISNESFRIDYRMKYSLRHMWVSDSLIKCLFTSCCSFLLLFFLFALLCVIQVCTYQKTIEKCTKSASLNYSVAKYSELKCSANTCSDFHLQYYEIDFYIHISKL